MTHEMLDIFEAETPYSTTTLPQLVRACVCVRACVHTCANFLFMR